MNRAVLLFCLLLGVVIYFGLHVLGWVVRGVVPGLTLGVLIFAGVWAIWWAKGRQL